MRARPVRSKIYLPIVRAGLVAGDWKFVGAAVMIGYLVPFFIKARFFKIPVFMWTGLLALVISYLFFFIIRVGRRPQWFQHTLKAATRSKLERRPLPLDAARNGARRSWLLPN